MYNEDVDELKRTLKGIMRNLDTFNEAYGQDAWQNICVCIVADGRHKSSKASLDYLEENKIFDSNMMHSALDKSPHIKLVSAASVACRSEWPPPMAVSYSTCLSRR